MTRIGFLLAAMLFLIPIAHADTDSTASLLEANVLDQPAPGTPGEGWFTVQLIDSIDTDYFKFLFPASELTNDPADPYGWLLQGHLAKWYAVLEWNNAERNIAPWTEVSDWIVDPQPAEAAAVPETSTWALAGIGGIALGLIMRARRQGDDHPARLGHPC